MIRDEDMELYNRVVESFRRYCERKGYIFQQPSVDYSEISHFNNSKKPYSIIQLCNTNTVLVAYYLNHRTNKLQWIE